MLKFKTEDDLKGEICDMLLQFYGETSFEYKQGKSLMDEYDDMDEDEFRGEVKAFLEDMRDEADAKGCNQLMYRKATIFLHLTQTMCWNKACCQNQLHEIELEGR